MPTPTPETTLRPASDFTLLLTVMVIAIIAILVSVAIASQMASVTQKRVMKTRELVDPYKHKMAVYFSSHNGRFLKDNDAIGLPASGKMETIEKEWNRETVLCIFS